jgi:hypothetical protein
MASVSSKITYHPEVLYEGDELDKFRLVFKGGRDFVQEYLQKYSENETDADFILRRKITYAPAHAKSAIWDIINSIFNRLVDVSRVDGGNTYNQAVEGNNGGVDNRSSSMTAFIGQEVLPELLVARKVGVMIDKLPGSAMTYAESKKTKPYLYTYRNEDIINWSRSVDNILTAVMLRQTYYDETVDGFVEWDAKVRLVTMTLTNQGVKVVIEEDGQTPTETILNLKRIPFVIFELSESLLKDVADHQIALLNMASSDVNFCVRANFPLYTEQYSVVSDLQTKVVNAVTTAQTGSPGTGGTPAKTAELGPTRGRRYPQNMERPEFIHPSPEPLKASMEKQDQIKTEIRELLHLALSRISNRSAQSKLADREGLEAGLSNIAQELQHGEQEIANIWADYQGEATASVLYPNNFTLQTDEQRQEEADRLSKQLPKVPSKTFQRAIALRIADLLVGQQVSQANFIKIADEIEVADVIYTDPETIRLDHEAGFVSTATASIARGYPKGDVEQAKKDHAERLLRVAIAQSQGAGQGAARGNPDASGSPAADAKEEKTISQSADTNPDAGGKQTK